MIDRTIAPEFKVPDKITYTHPTVQAMPNGIALHTICAGTQDVMRFALIFKAGTRYQSQFFAAAATLNLMSEGTQNHTSAEIAEKLDFYGSSLDVNIDRDWAIVSVYCLSKYCNETLQLLEQIVKHPIFPEKELEVYKQKHKEALRIEQEKVAFVARQQFYASLYGAEHPYGASGKVEDYDALTTDCLKNFHGSSFTSGNAFAVLSGKVGDAERAAVEKYFGAATWGNSSATVTDRWFEPQAQAQKQVYLPKADALQSAIRVGRVLFTKNHPDFTGMQVLCTVLGGYFGSRLMRNIREDKGYTYGIYSMVVPQQESGFLSIATEAGGEYTQNVLTEIGNEINLLRNEMISEEELNLVKQYIFGEMLRTLDGPWGLAEVCIDIKQSDLEENYIERFFNEVRAVTPQQLQQLAVRYLNTDDLYEVVAGAK